jgi:hypothetical protein
VSQWILCVSVVDFFLAIFTTEALRTHRDTEEKLKSEPSALSQTIPDMLAQFGIFNFDVLQPQHHIGI